MLFSVHIKMALIITLIVVMVDTDLYASIYFFDNYLGPFSFAAVVISVGLCLDYCPPHPGTFEHPKRSTR